MTPARLARYLFIAGLAGTLIIAGFVPSLFAMQWPQLACLGLSAIAAVLWLVFSLGTIRVWAKQRSTQWGLGLAVTAIAAVLFLVVINWAANTYNVKKDVTKNQFNSLSDQTKHLAESLTEEVSVRVWTTSIERMSLNVDMRRFLENYKIAGKGKIKVEIMNPNEARPEAERDAVKRDNLIIVRAASGREARVESFNDAKSEEQITNALIQVTRGGQGKKTVCFVTGHGEFALTVSAPEGLSTINDQLKNSQYETREITLAQETEKVPAGCEVLVIVGPKSDPLDREVTMIKDYLNHGGRVIGLFGAAVPAKWKDLASDYGVKVRGDLVIDPRVRPPYMAATKNFSQDVDIVKSLNAMVVFPEASTIDVSKSGAAAGTPNVRTFISTDAAAYAKQGDIKQIKSIGKSGGDLSGPLPLAVLIEKPVVEAVAPKIEVKPEAKKPAAKSGAWKLPSLINEARAQQDNGVHNDQDEQSLLGGATPEAPAKDGPKEVKPETQFIVFGNHAFVVNAFVSQMGNMDLFLNSVNYLLKDKDLIGIRPREIRQTTLEINPERSRKVNATVLLLALAFLWGGIMVYFRRAHV